MEFLRGDVVVAATPGDDVKLRPAVVVQSDLFNESHASVVVCPVTSTLVDAHLFRLLLEPSKQNGLRLPSQVMVDKMQAVRRERIADHIGRLLPRELEQLDDALRLWLSV